MGLLNRLREHRARRAYERNVKFRERHTPYGVMYGQVLAYRRNTEQSIGRPRSPERAAANNEMMGTVKEAFLSHPAATEQDFERCWPAIRDEIFKQYTMKVLDIMCT
jgi:hypothetical protein